MRNAEKKSVLKKHLTLAPVAALLVALTLTGCGGSGDKGIDLIGSPLGGPGGIVGDFNTYCAQRGGLVNYSGATPICKISRFFTVADFGFFPVLTASSQAGAAPSSYYNQFYVRPGDRLIFQGSGGWGSLEVDSYLGGLFNFYTWSCNSISLSGSGQPYSDGFRPGLLGVVGANEPFMIGSNINKVFDQEGPFKFGFNVPSDSTSLCYQVAIARFEIQHCENSSGATIPCP